MLGRSLDICKTDGTEWKPKIEKEQERERFSFMEEWWLDIENPLWDGLDFVGLLQDVWRLRFDIEFNDITFV